VQQRPLLLEVGWKLLPHYMHADALACGTLVEIEGLGELRWITT